jgi:hypothetical protein
MKNSVISSDGTDQALKAPHSRGRPFPKGNSGRPKGSKNKSTAILGQLLAEQAEQLLRKAIESALGGDESMLKFLLKPLLPRERMINIDLPAVHFADDAIETFGRITRAVASGEISPSEGAALSVLVRSQAEAIKLADVVRKIDLLVAKSMGETAP